MIRAASVVKALPRVVMAGTLLACGLGLAGCAGMSDGMTEAFADPAKYEFYDCKQLEAERKSLANRRAELQGLMDKAETGTGGVVVAEIAYRNDYIAVRGQQRFADEAWRKNNCRETPPGAAAVDAGPVRPTIKPAPASRAGGAVY